MKTIEELNTSKVPIVIIDKSLDELNDVVLFPEKVEKAKEVIAKVGLPKKIALPQTSVSPITDHGNDPFVVKKVEEAKSFFQKNGLNGLPKSVK
ncbi:hypothetical protein [uncultured Mucilaginibacter sp.]|uniref:hypothetical protein n=1 Tax=uncultured Mucilaginibacter sp. TaxID=797541 RepID=UPI0026249DD0|nr:hypothetical protein [uncultured Mucilaginibacter sp.]